MVTRRLRATVVDSVVVWLFIDNVALHWWYCHRRPERSLHYRGRQFHVCARCTGLISGGLLTWTAVPFAHALLPVCLCGVGLFSLDVATQLLGLRHSTNYLRVLTGFVVGWSGPSVELALCSLLLTSDI